MVDKVKVGIVGYGNLGKGVETGLENTSDMELFGVFSRRDPQNLKTQHSNTKAYHVDDLLDYKEEIDVLILCGGSQKDLPQQTPAYAKNFTVVDTYDNHNEIPNHFAKVDQAAKENDQVAVISVGWDPGLFSLNRVLGQAIMPKGNTYTFWGKGLSQGHSDAVRRVEGVKQGVQYTVPKQETLEAAQNGEAIDYNKLTAHDRDVYIVLEDGADEEQVKQAIIHMPDYFEGYKTTVHVIDEATFKSDHQGMPHGGTVLHQGQTSEENQSIYQFNLDLDSNPEFTAAVAIAYARAAAKLAKLGTKGAHTVYDIAPGLLSPKSPEDLRKNYL